jgi:hypothetical protein
MVRNVERRLGGGVLGCLWRGAGDVELCYARDAATRRASGADGHACRGQLAPAGVSEGV